MLPIDVMYCCENCMYVCEIHMKSFLPFVCVCVRARARVRLLNCQLSLMSIRFSLTVQFKCLW